MHRSIPAGSLACALALTLVANADVHPNPDVKMGPWEQTSTARYGGRPPIPEERLRQMPPEQRAKMLAAVQAAVSKPVTTKSCLTAGKMSRGLAFHDDDARCQSHIVCNTAPALSVTGTCRRDRGGTQSFRMRTQRVSSAAIKGGFSMTATGGGGAMSVERVIGGRWPGERCGGVR